MIAGPGRGFEIAQGRLGPGRIHHCMRLIGLAERSLELALERATSREAFGKPLANLGGNRERIAQARIAINQARLLVLHTAWLLDTKGLAGARSEVSQIKVAVPNMAIEVIDMAIQLHGAAGAVRGLPARRRLHQRSLAAAGRRSGRGAPRARRTVRTEALCLTAFSSPARRPGWVWRSRPASTGPGAASCVSDVDAEAAKATAEELGAQAIEARHHLRRGLGRRT